LKIGQYQELAVATLGPDSNPLALALGVGGEAGEVMEIIKKGNRPGKTVDFIHLHEEIGDVMWYLAVLAHYYGLDFEEIAEANINKLEKRYGKKAT
jgi:NTP pyrophosphatase (non-canonical NTP hydrolase)